MSVGGPQQDIAQHRECTCFPNYPRGGGVEHMQTCAQYEEPLPPPTVPQYIYDSLLRSYEAERGMRTDSARLISITMLLEEMLAELKRSNSTAREGAVSSIQIEDHPTKDRNVRVTSKIYAGSVLPVEEAIEAHGRAHRLAEQHALSGWAETIEATKVALRGGLGPDA